MHIDPAKLQRLIDRDEIREVCLRYTRGVDRHDEALIVSAYHPDAIDDHGTYIGEPAAFARHVNAVHSGHWIAHQHYVGNQTIEIDGDTAHCETYYLAVLKRDGGACDIAGGRYVDRLERRDGNWAIAERACLVEWNAEIAPKDGEVDPALFLQGEWGGADISYQRPLALTRAHRDLLAG